MMATYFTTDASSTNLLHASVRTHSEVQAVATMAEDAIIEGFRTQGTSLHPTNTDTDPEGVYQYTENGMDNTVNLWGYRALIAEAAGYDADQSNWSGFCKAMRQAIANVTSHRLREYDAVEGLESERAGREAWAYRGNRELRWPVGWDAPLKAYFPSGNDPRVIWSH